MQELDLETRKDRLSLASYNLAKNLKDKEDAKGLGELRAAKNQVDQSLLDLFDMDAFVGENRELTLGYIAMYRTEVARENNHNS